LENTQRDPDFRKLIRRLKAFALRLFAEHGLPGAGAVIPGLGVSAEDLAGKVLVEYCEGRIKHHASKGTLITLLCTAVRNDFYDALDRAPHKREQVPDPLARKSNEDSIKKDLDEYVNLGEQEPFIALDEKSYQRRVLRSLEDEPELKEICEAVFFLDAEKPSDIADALGIAVSEVHNRRKKLRRRLVEYHLVRLS
jgi:DNA-directed RNA polymerase specialized sigma24 family protein